MLANILVYSSAWLIVSIVASPQQDVPLPSAFNDTVAFKPVHSMTPENISTIVVPDAPELPVPALERSLLRVGTNNPAQANLTISDPPLPSSTIRRRRRRSGKRTRPTHVDD
jgi:hypothetical protein